VTKISTRNLEMVVVESTLRKKVVNFVFKGRDQSRWWASSSQDKSSCGSVPWSESVLVAVRGQDLSQGRYTTPLR
jgi:hypothetical protein